MGSGPPSHCSVARNDSGVCFAKNGGWVANCRNVEAPRAGPSSRSAGGFITNACRHRGRFSAGGSHQGRDRPRPAEVAIGLLGLLMAPAEAAAIPVVPSLVTNIWQALGMALAGMWLGKLLRR